ncbi:hypothetical protein [Algoriphagus confluentis]|uniref:XRE family transcriptional regulator n=1 Tax=Algoriphagus confluentis TaxID=1697556 RepID=A0ABQ6PM59_9BACT|nr:hypothetical protein Aconfl_16920 [Algoriphagus confluentis]
MDKIERKAFTKNFLEAIEHLKEKNLIKTDRDLELKAGIRSQRVTGMRSYLEKNNGKAYYATPDQIKKLNELFNVSLEFIYKGIYPIIERKKDITIAPERVSENYQTISKVMEEINFLKEKIDFLNERVDFLFEKLKSK